LATSLSLSEKGVRLAQTMQVGPCIPVGVQLATAGVGPTFGPAQRLSHFEGGNCAGGAEDGQGD
jgi:hypothetical protein